MSSAEQSSVRVIEVIAHRLGDERSQARAQNCCCALSVQLGRRIDHDDIGRDLRQRGIQIGVERRTRQFVFGGCAHQDGFADIDGGDQFVPGFSAQSFSIPRLTPPTPSAIVRILSGMVPLFRLQQR